MNFKIKPQTFTQYFGINKSQDQLDFLDIYANCDMTLFLDPYGISAMGTGWGRECESQIVTYFQHLIESIRNRDQKKVKQLLNALHEVNEISLGYSKDGLGGRGIGPIQAKEIQNAFENSQAAKTGDIRDIADCALLIPGINRDKISDITANILKKELILFTHRQCKLHSIPMKKVAVNNAFDYNTFLFTSFYTDLPVVNEKAKILLPISSVRQDPQLSKEKYYRNFVLEYLIAEHSHAGDALATVLRNGKIKVRIADIKRKYPIGTDLLYNFSKAHPQILEKYKSELRRTANKNTTPVLKTERKILSAKERINFISKIKPGNNDASSFHKMIYDSLIYIFGDRLSHPKMEVEINQGRKRIDIKFNNATKQGFFYELYSLHNIQCPKIFVECKNYGKDIGNPEIDQLQGRFSNRRGNFGILVCRSVKNKKDLLLRCKDSLNDKGHYIVVLDDNDMFTLINLKANGDETRIDDFLNSKLDELIM